MAVRSKVKQIIFGIFKPIHLNAFLKLFRLIIYNVNFIHVCQCGKKNEYIVGKDYYTFPKFVALIVLEGRIRFEVDKVLDRSTGPFFQNIYTDRIC